MITLRADIKNDLDQNAQLIGSVGKALAELVWNSIQYQPQGQVPRVDVRIVRRNGRLVQIEIKDNGRGMDETDVQRFFTMHATNQDRLDGRKGRGKFGTGGKAAAMAIADEMAVTTVRNGTRSLTTLKRDALVAGKSEVNLPHVASSTTDPNGTLIRLNRLRLQRFNEGAARAHVTKALGRALATAHVTWNGERLTYAEPAHDREWPFTPPPELAPLIGSPTLIVRHAERRLDDDDRGITITSLDVPQEFGFVGDSASHPLAASLFGLVEVPLLDDEDSEGRAAYTADRSLRLIRENERVHALLGWISTALGSVLRELDAEETTRRDEARREVLTQTARRVEDVLNSRFRDALRRMENVVRLVPPSAKGDGLDIDQGGTTETQVVEAAGSGVSLVRDPVGDQPWRMADPSEDGVPIRQREANENHRNSRRKSSDGEDDREVLGALEAGGGLRCRNDGKGTEEREVKHHRASFRVVPKSMTAQGPRAHYSADHMAIYVNIDHPQLAAAGSPEDGEFKVLMAECAVSEFALALVNLRIENGDPDIDPSKPWTILTAVRREMDETGAALAGAIRAYCAGPGEAEVSPAEPVPNASAVGE